MAAAVLMAVAVAVMIMAGSVKLLTNLPLVRQAAAGPIRRARRVRRAARRR